MYSCNHNMLCWAMSRKVVHRETCYLRCCLWGQTSFWKHKGQRQLFLCVTGTSFVILAPRDWNENEWTAVLNISETGCVCVSYATRTKQFKAYNYFYIYLQYNIADKNDTSYKKMGNSEIKQSVRIRESPSTEEESQTHLKLLETPGH